MSKSKNSEEVKLPPVPTFSKFSKFGGQKFGPNLKSSTGFNPKSIVTRPTFVTQHKGGGGGK